MTVRIRSLLCYAGQSGTGPNAVMLEPHTQTHTHTDTHTQTHTDTHTNTNTNTYTQLQ